MYYYVYSDNSLDYFKIDDSAILNIPMVEDKRINDIVRYNIYTLLTPGTVAILK